MKERYDSYKDSGVPWIGQVPAEWEVRRTKSYLDILSGYPFDSGNFTTDKSYMPLIRIRDITSGRAETYYKGDYPEEFVIDNDDLLVGMDGDFNVRWWTGGKALLNQRCCKIMTKDATLDIRFVYYVLPILLQDINRQTYATTVKHLSTFDIYGAKIPFPPLPVQRAIADYLDARCAAIDAYVASLEREAGLARELKQAVIARAVTRGLDPNTPMRDSGIPWIGQVPQGWDVRRIAYAYAENTKQNTTLEKTEAYQFNYGTLIKKSRKYDESVDSEVYSRYTIFSPDDIVINGLNLNYDFVSQRVAIAQTEGIITSAYVCITPRTNIHSPYFCYLFKAMDAMKLFHGMGTGIRLTLSYDELKKQPIPLPPLPIQRAIAGYLDARCAAIDAYVSSLEREAALARELKAREIADAVTGNVKITA